jgi:Fe-S cluster biosynthesis and repair protein YggX
MSETVRCSRCQQEGAALAANPFRTSQALRSLGELVQRRVCAKCYRAWLDNSVKLINDGKLELRDDRSQHVWITQMRAFLNLDEGRDPWKRFVGRRVRIETTANVIVIATVLRVDDEKIWVSDFDGGAIAKGFAPAQTGALGASGSATILRDFVRTIEEVAT